MQSIIGAFEGASALITVVQDVTAAWVDLGGEVDVKGFNRIAVWLNVDINDSLDIRIRALAKHTSAHADEFNLPIRTVSASDVKVEDEYFEFNVDADQFVVLAVELGNVIPLVQFQVQAGTVGATAGQIDSARITKGV